MSREPLVYDILLFLLQGGGKWISSLPCDPSIISSTRVVRLTQIAYIRGPKMEILGRFKSRQPFGQYCDDRIQR